MTVLEVAQVTVLPGHQEDFVADLLQAASTILPMAHGFIEFAGHGFGIERPLTYLFTIRWESLADHLEGFRGGDLFVQWRDLIGPHFDGTPVVEHFSG
jgi:heme-degrading monooxygenase HmoA